MIIILLHIAFGSLLADAHCFPTDPPVEEGLVNGYGRIGTKREHGVEHPEGLNLMGVH
jgi:hypothetical protein